MDCLVFLKMLELSKTKFCRTLIAQHTINCRAVDPAGSGPNLGDCLLLPRLVLYEEIVLAFCNRQTTTCLLKFLWPFFQVHLGELVLSQRRDVLVQQLDFYEPVVLPTIQLIMSKHHRKPSGLVVFCFTDMYQHPVPN